MARTIIASLARITDLDTNPYEVATLDNQQWAGGDYVLGQVTGVPTDLYYIEDCAGEMIAVQPGDRVVGAFGNRAATLEGVGSWTDIVDDKMHALTSAGLFGAFTSISKFLPIPMTLDYQGHLRRNNEKIRMADFALRSDNTQFGVPTILIVGTSMSAGKTKTGQLACKVLSSAGFNVIGTKLTGAGRYRDVISFRNMGAAEIYDFVDVGLPSTVVPEAVFRAAVRPLLHHIDSRRPDFLVAEAGASPLEPYNGAAAIDELGDNIHCTILSASDPYAALGVQNAFSLKPDLVTGPAANTTAAIDLVMKLTGVTAINIADPDSEPAFREFLADKLSVQLIRS